MNLRSSCCYEARTPKMPIGLVELLEDLSKDVLKNNPTDIYSFCANHMKKLLVIRDGSKSKKTLNIDQKIALAKLKIRERAALRCLNYDNQIKENNHNTKSLKESPQNSDVNAEEHVQERVIIVLENDLECNKEHEIIATVNYENPKFETVGDNKNVNTNEFLSPTTSVPLSDQISQSQVSRADTYIDNNNMNISEENVTNENINKSENLNEEENNAVLISESLIKTEDITENDDNSQELGLDINIGDNQCHNLKNEYTIEEVDKNTEKDDETKSSGVSNKNHIEVINDQQSKDDDSIIVYRETHNHCNNHSMDLETAAITIQKVFRSFLFRNKTQSVDDVVSVNLLVEDKEENKDHKEESNVINVNDRSALGTNRMETVLQTVNEEKSLSLSTDDSSTLSSAATIIQAHIRGFLVRNKFNNNKTTSSTSGIDSDAQSFTSLEGDHDNRKNKTILNIHIVPESGHFMSRDESILTSIDLSLDGSPPSSTNLHPLGYDKSERRKLKREDAVQSVSPPSNNSGKLSEDIDSVKEILTNNDNDDRSGVKTQISDDITDKNIFSINVMNDESISTMIDNVNEELVKSDDLINVKRLSTLVEMTSDEMDVITPSTNTEDQTTDSENDTKLLHSGECHDMVLPTKVSRNDASIVREFQNVVVYFLLWNNS